MIAVKISRLCGLVSTEFCLFDISVFRLLVPLGPFRSFKVCSEAKERVGCGKQREATSRIQSLVKLQPWFLSLR